MSNFGFYFPTRLIFGQGQFSAVGEEVSKLGKRALLVTYPSKSLAATVAQAVDLLKQAGVSTVIFNQIAANPTHTSINQGSQIARQEAVDVVIGLGGGTPMDAAKMIAVAAPLRRMTTRSVVSGLARAINWSAVGACSGAPGYSLPWFSTVVRL